MTNARKYGTNPPVYSLLHQQSPSQIISKTKGPFPKYTVQHGELPRALPRPAVLIGRPCAADTQCIHLNAFARSLLSLRRRCSSRAARWWTRRPPVCRCFLPPPSPPPLPAGVCRCHMSLLLCAVVSIYRVSAAPAEGSTRRSALGRLSTRACSLGDGQPSPAGSFV